MVPRKQSSVHMAIQTPRKPRTGASSAARERRTAQMLNKVHATGDKRAAGSHENPVRHDGRCEHGFGKGFYAQDLGTQLLDFFSSTGLRMPIICGAATYMITPMNVITAMPRPTVIRAKPRVSL